MYFFIHGGPGFNSQAEVELFSKELDHFVGWNEPSVLRDDIEGPVTFEMCCASIVSLFEQKLRELEPGEIVTFITHSIAHHYIPFVLDRIDLPSERLRVIMLAPGFNLDTLDNRIFDLASQDMPEEKEILLQDIPHGWSEERASKFVAVAKDQNLLSHYFKDPSYIAPFFSHYVGKFAQDPSNYFSIRSTLSSYGKKMRIDPTIIAGGADPIVELNELNIEASKLFNNFNLIVFDNSGHYPHIEEKGRFLEIIKNGKT